MQEMWKHQVIFAEDENYASYMLRKLNEEYTKWGLQINFRKTEYMVVDGVGRNLTMEDGSIVNYKYLGTNKGGSDEDISHRIGRGRVAIKQLNSIICTRP